MKNNSKNICLLFRKPATKFFSIEKVFNSIYNELNDLALIEIKTLPFSGIKINSIKKNREYIKLISSKVLHLTGHENYALIFFKGKKLLTIHDTGSSFKGNFLKRIIMYLFWYIIPAVLSHKITVVSETSKDEFLRLVPFARKKTVVIHNPLPFEVEKNEENFNKISPTVLFIGTKENKNLLRCFEALTDMECQLIIVGKLNTQQEKSLNENNLKYLNLQGINDEELKALYRKCDIVSFASTYEGFGLPILEGNAMGKVVMTSNTSSMPEIANDAALFVDPFDVNSIRAGYFELIQNDTLRKQLINNGYENCKRFAPKIIAKQYLEIYQSLMN